ncbi:hypothetical protein TAMA11512_17600 [Selenomonas sp. TAMA-11512]|uniref:four-carbon acid sugar kinase family protein n=1 Tax=Selenomonas sp. TAMA-11512 TaxID=3095337 RepID=UPI00308B4756|nr:hypothetical protein TAMA11512_17600 [Selenomonas sp. TAMA-11512]
MAERIGVIADDLTGATTVGVILARSKARTQVYFIANAALREEKDLGLDAVVISTNSRPLPPPMAKGLVHDAMAALKKMGAVYFSKRTDTTMRGGVGYEIDQMLEDLGDDAVAIVVPAMPESRRILVGGYSVIDGVALVKTPAARDVRTPVRENYIPALLAARASSLSTPSRSRMWMRLPRRA